MANIFQQNLDVNNHPTRNNFDLKHQVHGTYKFGYLYPFLCKPVVPGDSFEIDTAVGFKFMPLAFPTQSRMRVIVHYFAQRNKNIWPNWDNFVQGLEEHEHPYIKQPSSFFKTGSLSDFLDVPTSYIATRGLNFPVSGYMGQTPVIGTDPNSAGSQSLNFTNNASQSLFISPRIGSIEGNEDFPLRAFVTDYPSVSPLYAHPSLTLFSDVVPYVPLDGSFRAILHDSTGTGVDAIMSDFAGIARLGYAYSPSGASSPYADDVLISRRRAEVSVTPTVVADNVVVTSDFAHLDNQSFTSAYAEIKNNYPNATVFFFLQFEFLGDIFDVSKPSVSLSAKSSFLLDVNQSSALDLSELPDESNPFSASTDDAHISALPYRVYESIYNAFYRNTQTQPFTIDGVQQFNRYNTELGDGADLTPYHLYKRNWELDAYTSCLPSPQQGNAPLVGMSALGNIVIEDETGKTTATATDLSSGDGINIVMTSPAASIQHQQILLNMASSGMSISDFRQTNALQNFLETNIRKGYRYIDFIEGHFGVKPRYAEYDMPEFIGGFSKSVDVNMISNTAMTSDSPLGAYAGQANAFGGQGHKIRHYFDDFGWIMGIVSIVPDPAYSQILPKHFSYSKPLDYYFPEFSNVSYQPVLYREVSPVQSHLAFVGGDSSKKLTDTFGYQRPNHELIWYPDTVHGQFRLSLKDYLIHRLFEARPELGSQFLQITPEECNNIFQYTAADSDICMGQIIVDIKAKRPAPRLAIPSLGR